MLNSQTKERIEKDADEYARTYTGTRVIKRPYIAGAEAEAERAARLVSALEGIAKIVAPEIVNHVDAWRRMTEIHNTIATALTKYKNSK